MIERYTLPEMGEIWSDQKRLETWKTVEVAALAAFEDLGKVPPGTAAATESAACPTPEAVAERELVTNHDLAAFVDLLGQAAGAEASQWVHYGLTSSDVLDTAGGVLLSESADLLVSATAALRQVVTKRAVEHRETFMIGRTHGIWAEPTTFGLKLAGWAFELARHEERLETARDTVAVGKVSGAVGTYAHVPATVETAVCQSLGLGIEPASTQVTARDRHAQYLSTIALVGAGIERMATEVRHLQRSEVGEVMEGFRPGQKGSSAMPHKRNPILSERMTGMARLLRGYAQVGLENVALWHEREHLPLLGGAGSPPRRLDRTPLHAREVRWVGGEPGGRRRPDEDEPRVDERAGVQPGGPACACRGRSDPRRRIPNRAGECDEGVGWRGRSE